MNDDTLIYEYSTVRYVPRVEREEFINVGLLMACKRRRWFRASVDINETRLLAFDPQADVTQLKRQLSMFCDKDPYRNDFTAEERFRWLSAVKSSVIQTSRPHPGIICCRGDDANPDSLLEQLFQRLLRELVL